MNINNPKITWNISDRILGFSVELSVNTSHKSQDTMNNGNENGRVYYNFTSYKYKRRSDILSRTKQVKIAFIFYFYLRKSL